MSWLSDFLSALKPSSREEHFWAKIAGEEELENDYVPSSREEGFLYKVAQKIAALSEGGGGSGGGGAVYATFTESQGTWSCDKTYDELKEAYDSGSIIFGVLARTVVFPMIIASGGGQTGFGGCATFAEGDSSITSLSFYQFAVMSDGAVYGQELHKEFPVGSPH